MIKKGLFRPGSLSARIMANPNPQSTHQSIHTPKHTHTTHARTQKLGIDTSALLVSQPDHGEMAFNILDELVRSGSVDIVVVDSVSALTPRSEVEGDIGTPQVRRAWGKGAFVVFEGWGGGGVWECGKGGDCRRRRRAEPSAVDGVQCCVDDARVDPTGSETPHEDSRPH